MGDSQLRKIGIVGFGHIGQFLADRILESKDIELDFVWNRTKSKIPSQFEDYAINNLEDVLLRDVSLIVEVAHPTITRDFGASFLSRADYFIGSPTVLADQAILESLDSASTASGHGVYIPSGALWGGEDIRKMDELGTLKGLKVSMTKHPSCFKNVDEAITCKLDQMMAASAERAILFQGPVKDLCPLAPSNVNTMAAAAIAATKTLGFAGTVGALVADTAASNYHLVEVEVSGPGNFTVYSARKNPAGAGAVTGQQTFFAFWASLKRAFGKGSGIHLC